MRAIVIPKNGPPEVFEEREVEERRLTPVDVRVEVAAAGVNFADVMGRVGLYPDAPPLPYAPGYEIAGTVVEAGERAAERLPPGTRVMAVTRFGGYADLVRVPEHAAVPLADHVPFDAAAGTPVNYLTAWLGLVHMGNAKAGESVLVHGGAGGVLGNVGEPFGREIGIEGQVSGAKLPESQRQQDHGSIPLQMQADEVAGANAGGLQGAGQLTALLVQLLVGQGTGIVAQGNGVWLVGDNRGEQVQKGLANG